MNIVEESEEIIPPSHQLDKETVERLTLGRDQILAELSKVIGLTGKKLSGQYERWMSLPISELPNSI